MSFEFIIPVNKEDLFQSSSSNQYAIEHTYSKHELPGKLRDAYVAFSRQGTTFVLTEFDVLFSALVKFDELALSQQNDAWKVMSQAIQQLNSDLDKHFSGNDSSNPEVCKELVTITKMIVYLLCSFLQIYETRSLAVPGSDSKSSRKKKKPIDDGCDLEAERNFALVNLDQLVQMPIHKLWSPPVVEQEFVNLVSNLCYKILENPVISHVRMKGTRESVFRVIGALVKRYNHKLSCTLKIIQLLQHFEHVVPACVHGIVTLIELFNCGPMVVDLVREIGRVDPRDLARDTSSSRNYAAFLAELAEKVPSVFIPCVSLLSVHLEEESFTMRNSVLTIFSEIIIQELSGENLDERKRELRDQLLEPLLEHLHDVHSFVRSKALQLWHKLSMKQAIPLNLQHKVLNMAAGRLIDKTSTVRKHAVELLIVLMQSNPYASRLQLPELESQLKAEEAKLQEIIQLEEKERPQKIQIDPTKVGPTKLELWNAMEPEVLEAITEVFEEEDENSVSTSELTEEQAFDYLNQGNYKRIVRMLIADEDDPTEILHKIKKMFVGEQANDTNEREERDQLIRQAVEQEDAEENCEVQKEEESREITKQRTFVLYLKDSLAFASSVHGAIPVVCQLLCSKQLSDILEAIDFFVTAFEFEILDAMVGIRRMLSLIWSPETDVKDAVVRAYKRLYMDMDSGGANKKRALQVVSNLTALISCSTQGELASLEELIALCVKTDDLPKICIQVMWERFSMALPDTTEEESRSALMLLAMVASAQVRVVTSNVNVLVSVGLGERGAKDFRLAHLTCAALLKMAPTKTATDSQTLPMRLPPTHEIFESVSKLLIEGLTRLEDPHYSQFATTAVSLIYTLAEHPDSIMTDVMKEMCSFLYKSNQGSIEGDNLESEVSVAVLTRIFVVAGQVAIRQLLHLDVHVYSELRRRARVREERHEVSSKLKRNLIQSASRRRASCARSLQPDNDAGDDDELVGAVADDDEAEYVKKICETEIVTGGASFLSSLAPLVVAVNSNSAKYTDPSLRAAASLCLAEFMLVSQSFCSDNMRLLFTVLERSPEEVIRSNLVIAMGDINFRFPNLIEPWTPHLYGRLRDDSLIVKRTTLNVLTHLILNDMVKVKGQISDIALCIIDPDTRISGMSRMFFNEFARKGNALYNVMPDIISRLCDPEAAVNEEDFRIVLKWIMALIQKEKQSESLVEKIILRLGASRTERQSRDLVFCLSLLTFNERSLRRILENWNCISDKIHEEAVKDALLSILAASKKLAKQETRALVEEIEAKIAETIEANEDEQQVVRKAHASQTTKVSSKNKPKRKQKARAMESEEEDDGEDEEEEDEDEENENEAMPHPAHVDKATPKKRPQQKQARSIRKRNVAISSSSGECSSAEEEVPVLKAPGKMAKELRSLRATRRRVGVTSGESEEDDFIKPELPSGKLKAEKSKLPEKRRASTRSRK